MKLVFAIVQNEDAKKLINALNSKGFSVTKIASSGGFLKGGNTTIMMGIEDDQVELALEIIKNESKMRKHYMVSPQTSMVGYSHANASPIEITVGGAVVFVCDVWRHEHF
ncbi:MAG TPA: hypothetical protein GXZ61_01540 [Clostridiales bacterium]|jgi:uncharacterized protein YaaQ|nr:hypothetical protein [Clostridiales bacterium]